MPFLKTLFEIFKIPFEILGASGSNVSSQLRSIESMLSLLVDLISSTLVPSVLAPDTSILSEILVTPSTNCILYPSAILLGLPTIIGLLDQILQISLNTIGRDRINRKFLTFKQINRTIVAAKRFPF